MCTCVHISPLFVRAIDLSSGLRWPTCWHAFWTRALSLSLAEMDVFACTPACALRFYHHLLSRGWASLESDVCQSRLGVFVVPTSARIFHRSLAPTIQFCGWAHFQSGSFTPSIFAEFTFNRLCQWVLPRQKPVQRTKRCELWPIARNCRVNMCARGAITKTTQQKLTPFIYLLFGLFLFVCNTPLLQYFQVWHGMTWQFHSIT